MSPLQLQVLIEACANSLSASGKALSLVQAECQFEAECGQNNSSKAQDFRDAAEWLKTTNSEILSALQSLSSPIVIWAIRDEAAPSAMELVQEMSS